jgi:hypothetical protein
VFSLTHELRYYESMEQEMRHAKLGGGGGGGYGGGPRFEGGGAGGPPYGAGGPRRYGGGGPPMKMGQVRVWWLAACGYRSSDHPALPCCHERHA